MDWCLPAEKDGGGACARVEVGLATSVPFSAEVALLECRQHGGGVGMDYSQHSDMVIVCDGSVAADKRIARV